MALETAQQLGQGRRLAGVVVEAAQQDVFKADAPAGGGHIVAGNHQEVLAIG